MGSLTKGIPYVGALGLSVRWDPSFVMGLLPR